MRLSAARQAEYTEYYRGEMKKYQAENERLRAALEAVEDALRARIEDLENELRSVKYEANVDARYAAQCNDEAAQLDKENRILRHQIAVMQLEAMQLRNARHDR